MSATFLNRNSNWSISKCWRVHVMMITGSYNLQSTIPHNAVLCTLNQRSTKFERSHDNWRRDILDIRISGNETENSKSHHPHETVRIILPPSPAPCKQPRRRIYCVTHKRSKYHHITKDFWLYCTTNRRGRTRWATSKRFKMASCSP